MVFSNFSHALARTPRKLSNERNLELEDEDAAEGEMFEDDDEAQSEERVRKRAKRHVISNPVTSPELKQRTWSTCAEALEWIRQNRFDRDNKSWEMVNPGRVFGNSFHIKCRNSVNSCF